MRILIANRGEIARRAIRTAHRLGHETVAVYATPDAGAPFVDDADVAVHIGPADLASSYLSVDAVLDAAASSGATAIHPGYGFLSENAEFARRVAEAGMVWIGPNADVIASMGSKIEARRIAAAAGVAIIPGFDESQDPDDLRAAADRIGYPILVKAAAGGGGKGIRIAHEPAEFDAALGDASSEALRSFGDGAMIVERYIQRPRHIEVQVVGDKHGGAIHLGTRECSVQRRYQKLLEEAPATNLSDETRAGLHRQAVELTASIGYDSVGTVEFIVDDDTGDLFFLEMNTRLQVEHPVTEETTGLDLVELQIGSAVGDALPLAQDDVEFSGHAIEVRINAEDPTAGFVPRTGTVEAVVIPPSTPEGAVRWDSGVVDGSLVSPFYDPMVAKLIVSSTSRAGALRTLRTALDAVVVGGVVTNTGFHRWLIDQQPVLDGRVTTRFLDDELAAGSLPGVDPEFIDRAAAGAAAAIRADRRGRSGNGAWSTLGDFCVTPERPERTVILEHIAGPGSGDDLLDSPCVARGVAVVRGDRVYVNLDGTNHTFRAVERSEAWAGAAGAGSTNADSVVSPFPAVVTELRVAVGDTVETGQVVAVIEAMKMLHPLTSPRDGVVAAVLVEVGEQTVSDQSIVNLEQESP